MWTHGQRFGIRTQDKIDIPSLLAEGSVHPRTPGEERRIRSRERITSRPQADPAAKAAASRRFARAFDWAAIAVAVAFGGALIFEAASTSLESPMEQTREALRRDQPSMSGTR